MIRFYLLILLFLTASCNKGIRQSYEIVEGQFESLVLNAPIELVWQSKLKAYPQTTVHLNDSLLLVGDSDGGIVVVNLNNGERADRYWRPLKNPVQIYGYDESQLYFSSEAVKAVFAWNLTSAKKKWKQDFAFDYDEMLVLNDTLYFKSDSILARVNAATGNALPAKKLDEKLAPGFVCINDKFYTCTENGHLWVMDKKLNISESRDLGIKLVEVMRQQRDFLVAYNTTGSVRVYSPHLDSIVFTGDFHKLLYATPSIGNNQLFVPFADGQVAAYSVENDLLIWSYNGAGLLNLDILPDNDGVIIPYARGVVVSISQRDGTVQWRYDHGKSLNFAELTSRGVLLGHRREISMIGVKDEK